MKKDETQIELALLDRANFLERWWNTHVKLFTEPTVCIPAEGMPFPKTIVNPISFLTWSGGLFLLMTTFFPVLSSVNAGFNWTLFWKSVGQFWEKNSIADLLLWYFIPIGLTLITIAITALVFYGGNKKRLTRILAVSVYPLVLILDIFLLRYMIATLFVEASYSLEWGEAVINKKVAGYKIIDFLPLVLALYPLVKMIIAFHIAYKDRGVYYLLLIMFFIMSGGMYYKKEVSQRIKQIKLLIIESEKKKEDEEKKNKQQVSVPIKDSVITAATDSAAARPSNINILVSAAPNHDSIMHVTANQKGKHKWFEFDVVLSNTGNFPAQLPADLKACVTLKIDQDAFVHRTTKSKYFWFDIKNTGTAVPELAPNSSITLHMRKSIDAKTYRWIYDVCRLRDETNLRMFVEYMMSDESKQFKVNRAMKFDLYYTKQDKFFSNP